MELWAKRHSWENYLQNRQPGHPPYERIRGADAAHLAYGNELIVLPGGYVRPHLLLTDDCLLPAGCNHEGIVFTNERLIVGNMVKAILTAGKNGVAVKTDGTYKISYEGNWTLFSFGSHAVVYRPGNKETVCTYRPWLFAYVKAESHFCLRDLLMPALLALVKSESAQLTADY